MNRKQQVRKFGTFFSICLISVYRLNCIIIKSETKNTNCIKNNKKIRNNLLNLNIWNNHEIKTNKLIVIHASK